jgi:hypothetical protein
MLSTMFEGTRNRVIATLADVRSTWSQPRQQRGEKLPKPNSTRRTEQAMNATTLKAEVIETQTPQAEEAAAAEVLKELSSIELAYVGGGIATVSFV